MDAKGVIGNVCGFLTVVGGIFLLNAFRHMEISWRDVSSASKKPSSTVSSVERLDDRAETHQLLDSEEYGGSNPSLNGVSGRGSV